MYLNVLSTIGRKKSAFVIEATEEIIEHARKESRKLGLDKSELVGLTGSLYEKGKISRAGITLLMYALRTEAWKIARETDCNCINYLIEPMANGYLISNLGILSVDSRDKATEIITAFSQNQMC